MGLMSWQCYGCVLGQMERHMERVWNLNSRTDKNQDNCGFGVAWFCYVISRWNKYYQECGLMFYWLSINGICGMRSKMPQQILLGPNLFRTNLIRHIHKHPIISIPTFYVRGFPHRRLHKFRPTGWNTMHTKSSRNALRFFCTLTESIGFRSIRRNIIGRLLNANTYFYERCAVSIIDDWVRLINYELRLCDYDGCYMTCTIRYVYVWMTVKFSRVYRTHSRVRFRNKNHTVPMRMMRNSAHIHKRAVFCVRRPMLLKTDDNARIEGSTATLAKWFIRMLACKPNWRSLHS